MIPGCRTTAELATHRRVAMWLALAIGLALQWAAPDASARNAIFTSGARAAVAGISTPAARASGPREPAAVETGLPEQDIAGLTVAEVSDEFLAAPRPVQPVEHGASVLAAAAYVDPRAAFPRAFRPRAPPLAS